MENKKNSKYRKKERQKEIFSNNVNAFTVTFDFEFNMDLLNKIF